ncbi:MAG: C1 family peptidase [Clostridia bacterium]|nr:C1 family peptidase [Clostridia bacterium]
MNAIKNNDVERYLEAYEAKQDAKLIHNALYKLSLNDLAFVGDNMVGKSFNFSVDIKTLPATAQKSTGRCWLFAATNILRERVAKEKNLENFELSQAWLAFWDKFERCNYYLETVIKLIDRDIDDRTLNFVMTCGVSDGGQWDMFVNVIEKYGIVPKDVYPDNAQSSSTAQLNTQLNINLKRCTAKLREMYANGESNEKIAAAKDEMLKKIYVFLVTCYGVPPKSFDFEYKDKDGNIGIEKNYTPLTFKEKYVGDFLSDYISIINGPTADKPFYKLYTVDLLGNVVDGNEIRYLNLPMDEFKEAVISQLKDGDLVWFGSDCGKFSERDTKALWDPALYDYESVTGLDLDMTKEESLDYRYSAMNHAMVLTGVHLVDGKPTRWKIENSWGSDGPNNGYFFCTDEWLDKYVFQAVVNRKYLKKYESALKEEPIVLKPWDPMGTLAD